VAAGRARPRPSRALRRIADPDTGIKLRRPSDSIPAPLATRSMGAIRSARTWNIREPPIGGSRRFGTGDTGRLAPPGCAHARHGRRPGTVLVARSYVGRRSLAHRDSIQGRETAPLTRDLGG
jgi:hypothetical protein